MINMSVVAMAALSKTSNALTVSAGRDPSADFVLPGSRIFSAYAAPVHGFVPKGGPLRMVCLEHLRDDYRMLPECKSAKEIADLLATYPETAAVHLTFTTSTGPSFMEIPISNLNFELLFVGRAFGI